jgi:hypothetical protein
LEWKTAIAAGTTGIHVGTIESAAATRWPPSEPDAEHAGNPLAPELTATTAIESQLAR